MVIGVEYPRTVSPDASRTTTRTPGAIAEPAVTVEGSTAKARTAGTAGSVIESSPPQPIIPAAEIQSAEATRRVTARRDCGWCALHRANRLPGQYLRATSMSSSDDSPAPTVGGEEVR